MKPQFQGIIPIDKPEGMPSSGVTARVKRILGVKTGHFGTLDPLASGVLPIMLGRATRLSLYLQSEKEYVAEMKLGIKTDTGDITGKTVKEAEVLPLDEEKVKKAVSCFIGTVMQTPPIYSALSVGGVKLYKYAVKGETVEIEARPVEIYSNEVISFDGERIKMRIRCGAGTYIRTLCEDIAEKLGTVGTMTSLRRTLSGGFSEKETVNLEEFMNSDAPEKYIIPPEKVISHLPAVTLDESAVRYYKNGGEINSGRTYGLAEGNFRVFYNDELLGVGEGYKENGKLFLRSVWQLMKEGEE